MPKAQGQNIDQIRVEVSILRRLQNCPGVLQLIDCIEDSRSVHLVAELCTGGDLQKHVETYGPLNEKQLNAVAFQILKTIKACHGKGILHGDVKPANFCFTHGSASNKTPSTLVKAIDFGCSRILDSPRLSHGHGTLMFMAPEVFRRDYGLKSDMWSVGVTLYWLYCQKLPFWNTGRQSNIALLNDIIAAVTTGHINYGDGPWLRMSPEGRDFISRCLERDEGRRLGAEEAFRHPWFAKLVAVDQHW